MWLTTVELKRTETTHWPQGLILNDHETLRHIVFVKRCAHIAYYGNIIKKTLKSNTNLKY